MCAVRCRQWLISERRDKKMDREREEKQRYAANPIEIGRRQVSLKKAWPNKFNKNRKKQCFDRNHLRALKKRRK